MSKTKNIPERDAKGKLRYPVGAHSPAFESLTKAEQERKSELYRKAAAKAWITIRGKKAAEEPEETEKEVAEALETKFGLERDMQRALRSNIEQLEQGLKIVDGGAEQTVASGRIDITAQDKHGSTVVIELKAGEADRDAIAQILSYMGDISGDSGKPVRGILVAGDFHTRAISASRAVQNVELKRYSFKFLFEPATKPGTQT